MAARREVSDYDLATVGHGVLWALDLIVMGQWPSTLGFVSFCD